ncbi:MAG: nucleotide exchange factor GrpE [Gammaproteobacteria bacterium]|nr:MAG: nucleotide exchange factor GrpE [Gammaproteobacteria bacterium]
MEKQEENRTEKPEEIQEDLEALQQRLKEAEAKAESYREEMLRARADLENERRRFQRELENAHKYAIERFVQELLPVKDSLELGLAAALEAPDVKKIEEGMELTLKMLHSVMEKFNIEEVNPVGERFDPDLHEAMSTIETTDVEPHTVVTVYQKGYLLNGRLLRPALVVVSKLPSGQGDEQA